MNDSSNEPHALDFASVQVSNLERSEAFYTDVLGFAVDEGVGPPHARVFQQERGGIFAIRTPTDDLDGPIGQGVSLWFDVADIEAVYERVRESDAAIVEELAQGGFGPEFSLRDPDGYRLTVHQTSG